VGVAIRLVDSLRVRPGWLPGLFTRLAAWNPRRSVFLRRGAKKGEKHRRHREFTEISPNFHNPCLWKTHGETARLCGDFPLRKHN